MKSYSILFITFLLATISCNDKTSTSETSQEDNKIDTITFALDWTPNVLHTGFFVALHYDWFEDENLHIEWYSTEIDNYQKKPIMRVIDHEADIAIGPSEHLFTFSDYGQKAKAIATILQKGQSVFAVKQESGIENISDLDNKTYIGYNTPLENEILSAMIKHGGGKGSFESTTPDRLKVWDAFLENKGDIVWIFSHWEGVLAQLNDTPLQYFYPEDFGVPYGYSSVLFARAEMSEEEAIKLKKFLNILSKGYQYAYENSEKEIVNILQHYIAHPDYEDAEMLTLALADIKPSFLQSETKSWGRMQDSLWLNYVDWTIKNGRIFGEEKDVDAGVFYTNELL